MIFWLTLEATFERKGGPSEMFQSNHLVGFFGDVGCFFFLKE